MINKITKVFIGVSLLVLGLIVLLPLLTFAEENYPKKGDLRCPNGKSSSTCQMFDAEDNKIETANSTVQKVIITKQNDAKDVTVKKIVTKTDINGVLNVKFEFEGNKTKLIGTKEKPYIVIIRDASTSLSQAEHDASTKAAISFSKKMTENGKKYNLALIQFGDSLSNNTFSSFSSNDFSDVKFCTRENVNDSDCKHGENSDNIDSNIYFAFQKAYKLFTSKNVPENSSKYIVILGDGRYWHIRDVDKRWGNVKDDELKKLKSIKNLNLFGMYYKASSGGGTYVTSGYPNPWALGVKYCDGKTTYIECDMLLMTELIGDPFGDPCNDNKGNCRYTSSDKDYQDMFDYIASIIDDKHQKEEKIPYEIVDKLGDEFKTTSTNKNKITIKEKNIDNEFEIKIDSSAVDGWHKTNNSFTLYYDSDDDNPYFTSNDNPELYWEQESNDLIACSDSTVKLSQKSEKNDYYKIVCEQGWDNVDGYFAELTINNLNLAETKFTVSNREGFPVSLKLSSNLKCTFEFNKDLFLEDYNNLTNELENLNQVKSDIDKDTKGIASIKKKIEKMEKILSNYIEKSSVELEKLKIFKDYKEIFEKQDAIFRVTYSTTKYEEINLENVGDFEATISCDDTNIEPEELLKQQVYMNRVCTLTSSKSMQLPNYCLSMVGGTSEKCNLDSGTQLDGAHYYYVNSDKSGYLSVFINNATYNGDTIKLEGEKKNANNPRCKFDVVTSKAKPILYRQIELSDPFLKTKYKTDQKRTVGKNWLNKSMKYNFTNIIDKKIWDKDFEYQYQMSKQNIEQIKKDTSQEGVNSYLGRDCQFDNNNQYKCAFVRPDASNNGSSELFTNIKVN